MNIELQAPLNWNSKRPNVFDMFPIESVSDVERVIKFYKWVPQTEKVELRQKLNNALKKFNMVVDITAESKLQHYISPQHFRIVEPWEVSHTTRDVMAQVEMLLKHIRQDCSFGSGSVENILKYFSDELNKEGYRSIAHGVNVWFMEMVDVNPKDYIDSITSENNFQKIFDCVTYILKQWFEFNSRIEQVDENMNLLLSFIEDARRSMFDDIINAKAFKSGTLDLLKLMVTDKTRLPIIHLCRNVQVELISNRSDKADTFDLVDKLESEIASIYDIPSYPSFTFNLEDVLQKASLSFPVVESIKTLEMTKIEQQSHLNIISEYNSIASEVMTESMFPTLVDVFGKLEKKVFYDNLKRYGKKINLTDQTKFIINHVDFASHVRNVKTIDNKEFTIAKINEGVAIVLEGQAPNEIKLIELYSDEQFNETLIENLTCHPQDFNKDVTAHIHTVTFSQPVQVESEKLTEGIVFDEEGGFVLSFKPKSSYMDQYSENHKILVQNSRAENYDGVKTNLAFLFSLINEIERNVLYTKKKVSEARRKDAEKARMFAINDFKTYLKVVLAKDPSFNFTTYYEQSNYGKIVFGFKKEEIVGIKRLFQTIILK